MTDLLLGIVASLLSIFLIWLGKECILPEVKRKIFSDLPSVVGKYELIKMSPYNQNEEDEGTPIRKIVLKQSGPKVWGYVVDDSTKSKSRVSGHITASRILNFSFESEDSNIHDHGTAMLKLSFDGREFTGIVTFLCSCCEDITPTRVVMRKKDFA